jgi:tetratricopeptide (TPR) repeat protein
MLNIFKNHSTKISLFIISALCILLFINTLNNSFMWDEKELIQDNYHIKSLKRVPFLFSPQYWKFYHRGTQGQYRPIRALSFAIDYSISRMNPAGYHITNILLHLINCLLVFALVKSLLKYNPGSGSKYISLITAVFFAAHPIHVESITWIKNRSDILCLLFGITAFLFFIKYFKKNKLRYYMGSVLCFVLSIFSKEMGLSLPFIILGFIYCFVEKKQRLKALMLNAVFFIIGAGFIFFKKKMLGMVIYQDESRLLGLYPHILAVIKTIGTYLMLLVYPFKLNAERVFIIPAGFLESSVLSAAGAITLFIVILCKAYERSKLLSFSLLWIILSILPAANILFIWSRPLAEQRLYIPSVGFCMVLAIFIDWLVKRFKSRSIATIAFILLIASYSFQTIVRNQDWLNPLVFWKKTVEDSPSSARAYSNLGNAYVKTGDLDKAEKAFEQAIRLDGRHFQAYNNLGNIYAEQAKSLLAKLKIGQLPTEKLLAALELFKKSVEIDPNNFDSYNNMGAVYEMLRQDDKAEEFYKKAMEINPFYDKAYLNLGLLYLKKRNFQKAEENFKRSIEINPAYSHAYNNLGVVYDNTGELPKALEAFKKVVELDPEYANAYYNIGYNYLRQDKTQKAIEFFNKTKEVDPGHIDAYLVLSLIYMQSEDYDRAIKEYLNLLAIEPENPVACNNISYAYFKIGNYQEAVRYMEKARKAGFKVNPAFEAQLKQYIQAD